MVKSFFGVLLAMVGVVAAGPCFGEPAWQVGVGETLEKIRKGDPWQDRWKDEADLALAGNEYEAFQLVIGAGGHSLEEVRVAMSPLRREGGSEVLSTALLRVEDVEVFNLWNGDENLGWWPDPLVPLEPFKVAPGERQRIWVTVHAPAGAVAGTYRGEIMVAFRGGETRVPVAATVWDFSLPSVQNFTLAIPIWGGYMERMWPGSQTPERRRAFLDMLYDHRIAPLPLESEEEVAHALRRGVRDIYLTAFPKDRVDEEKIPALEKQSRLWAKNGWNQMARSYVLLGDEAPPEFYEIIQTQGRLVREAAPEVVRRFTVSPENSHKGLSYAFRKLKGAGDTLILGNPTDATTRQARAAGFSLWWYFVADHYYIPRSALNIRQVFWRHWKYRVPGQLHWGMAYFGDANAEGVEGKKWPEIPWNTRPAPPGDPRGENFVGSRGGDGSLVYPAPGGTAFWPSIRLELLRDGMEDYEYFHLLDELTHQLEASAPEAQRDQIAENRRLLEIEDHLIRSYAESDPRPEAYRDYRRRVAEAIQASIR